jgi:hypothetical protein
MKYTEIGEDGEIWHWEEEPSDDPLDRTFKSHSVANDFARLVDFHFGVIIWVIGVAFVIVGMMYFG